MIKKYSVFLVLLMLLFLSVIFGLLLGSVFIGPFDASSVSSIIFWQIRMPRVFLAAIIGAMLSVSGAVLQGVLKNPLSDPYILGISSGGAVGAAISMILSFPLYAVCSFAFLGALASVLIVYNFSKVSGSTRPETLVLAGVAVGSFFGAVLVSVVMFSDKLQSVYFWLFGSFSLANWFFVNIASVVAAIGIGVALIFSRQLNILMLSDEEAVSLGVNVRFVRAVLLTCSSVLSAVSVAICGIIGFVGLIVPHVVRLLIGQNNVYLIPASGLLGAVFMVFADMLSRTILSPAEIPVGIITAFIGAPFFIFLLRTK